jgi:hypothetical protein
LPADHSKLSPRLLHSPGMKAGAVCFAIKGRRQLARFIYFAVIAAVAE